MLKINKIKLNSFACLTTNILYKYYLIYANKGMKNSKIKEFFFFINSL